MTHDATHTSHTAGPRVLVAAQGTALSESVLHTTRALLRLGNDELVGLFVEDTRLHLAAAVPFTREVGHHSGLVRSFEPHDLERLIRHRASAFEAQLAALAEEGARHWSIEHRRGDLIAETLQALGEGSLAILGSGGAASNVRRIGELPHSPRLTVAISAHAETLAPLHQAVALARALNREVDLMVVTRDTRRCERVRSDVLHGEFGEAIRSISQCPELTANVVKGLRGDMLVASADVLPEDPQARSEILVQCAGTLLLLAE